jgi:hypothetical protein
METHTSAASVSLSPTAVSISYAAPVGSSPTSSPVTIELDARSCSGAIELVKVEGTTTTYIHLLEFQVMSGGTNVALKQATSQSTTLSSFAASRVGDGSNTTFSHSNQGPAQWFEVDLVDKGCPSDTGLPRKQPTKVRDYVTCLFEKA